MEILYFNNAAKALRKMDAPTKYLAWDPDFTKVTAAEKASIEESEAAFLRGEFVRAEDI